MIHNEIQKRIKCPLTSILPAPHAAVNSSSAGAAEKRASLSTSEQMLWSLLKLCLQRGCILYSSSVEEGDPQQQQQQQQQQSPEHRVIQLLVDSSSSSSSSCSFSSSSSSMVLGKQFHSTAADERITPDMSASRLLYDRFSDGLITAAAPSGPSLTTTSSIPSSSSNHSLYLEMESLLLLGQRDEALQLAVASKQWALAMLLSSVTSADKYQEVVRAYANSHFPVGTPMNLLSLMYSNQAVRSLMEIADYPTTTATTTNTSIISGTTTTTHAAHGSSSSSDQLKMWRHNLAAVLSNKGTDWRSILKMLGYKLQMAEEVGTVGVSSCIIIIISIIIIIISSSS
jgi:hypothetical protein